jgi:hypothetical protein
MPDPTSSPTPSSFDEFDQQQRSFDKIVAWQQKLVEQAARTAKARPGERIVGLIVENGVPDVAAIRSALGAAGTIPADDVVGVVPRHFALAIAGVVGDEDESMEDDVSGPRRRLPILFIAPTGCRWWRAEYPVDEPSS